jgi:hypothetical protein
VEIIVIIKLYGDGSTLMKFVQLKLTRLRIGFEDNIKMDLREIGFGDVDWINWAQDRDRWLVLVNTVMNLRVP